MQHLGLIKAAVDHVFIVPFSEKKHYEIVERVFSEVPADSIVEGFIENEPIKEKG